MGPMQRRFEFEDAFPFAMVYRDRKNPQTELPDHLHEWYELVYVYSGKGVFFIDQTFHDMREGDLFAIPGNVIHQAFPDQEDPVTSTAVFFSPVLVGQASYGEAFTYTTPFEQCKLRKQFRCQLPETDRAVTSQLLDEVNDELLCGRPGARHAVALKLQQLLLLLHRNSLAEHSRQPANTVNAPTWMKDILLHIDEQLHMPLRLSLLAQRACVTGSHFSRVFKELTGLTVTDYIAAKRIIKAKELLFETDGKLSTIAEQCGFESMTHFHRTFKKIAGCAPAAYKKQKLAEMSERS